MSGKIKDITGLRFNRLNVLRFSHSDDNGSHWICRCDCGNVKVFQSDNIKNGSIKSCGCIRKERMASLKRTHGLSRIDGKHTRLFRIWSGMIDRCYRLKNKSYKYYGGKGIVVSKEWKNFNNFHNWAINNGYLSNLTIDRIKSSGPYSKENCQWITLSENSKRANSTTN